jgi:hypothetical protein
VHDAAFDHGLIAFEYLRMLLSSRSKRELPSRAVADNFGVYEGETLRFPEGAVLPELAFLSEHRRHRFHNSG